MVFETKKYIRLFFKALLESDLNHITLKFKQNWCWYTGSLSLSFLSFVYYSVDPSGDEDDDDDDDSCLLRWVQLSAALVCVRARLSVFAQ